MSWMKCNARKIPKIAALVIAALIIMAVFMLLKFEAPGGLSRVKPVFQSDYKDTIVTIGGENKSVWTSGCGAVALSMAAGYMTGIDISCEDMFKWACDRGYYSGNGLDHRALAEMLKPYGLTGRWIDNDKLGEVKKALLKGFPVVAHVGPGTFTKNGHYILLIGYENGRALVNDPGSRERSGKYFDLELIQKQLRRERSFMMISRA